MIKFSEISKLETNNISLMNQLYITLSPEKLKTDYSNIINIQRQLFILKIGTLEQIATYILYILSNNNCYNIIIKKPIDILEVITLNLLKKEVNYTINLSNFIELSKYKNLSKLEFLIEALKVASESTSHSNILSVLSILSEIYLPHKQNILKNVIITLTSYYEHDISNSLNVDLIINLLEDINFGLEEYIEESMVEILNSKLTVNSMRHSLFSSIDPIEESILIISKHKDLELEKALQTIDHGISSSDRQSIYESLLHLSEAVINSKNLQLLSKFEDHKKTLDLYLKKK